MIEKLLEAGSVKNKLGKKNAGSSLIEVISDCLRDQQIGNALKLLLWGSNLFSGCWPLDEREEKWFHNWHKK